MFATTNNYDSSEVTVKKKGIDKGIFSRLPGPWHLIDLNLAHRTATVEEEELFFAENGQVDESQETSSVVLQVDY